MIGDMVIIHKQSDYEVNDIITYQGNNHPITHRLIEKTPNGYITQGDANNAKDGEIEQSQVIGKVVKTIPKVGHVILFFQEPLGMILLMLSLFAIIEAPRLIGKILKNSRENKTENV